MKKLRISPEEFATNDMNFYDLFIPPLDDEDVDNQAEAEGDILDCDDPDVEKDLLKYVEAIDDANQLLDKLFSGCDCYIIQLAIESSWVALITKAVDKIIKLDITSARYDDAYKCFFDKLFRGVMEKKSVEIKNYLDQRFEIKAKIKLTKEQQNQDLILKKLTALFESKEEHCGFKSLFYEKESGLEPGVNESKKLLKLLDFSIEVIPVGMLHFCLNHLESWDRAKYEEVIKNYIESDPKGVGGAWKQDLLGCVEDMSNQEGCEQKASVLGNHAHIKKLHLEGRDLLALVSDSFKKFRKFLWKQRWLVVRMTVLALWIVSCFILPPYTLYFSAVNLLAGCVLMDAYDEAKIFKTWWQFAGNLLRPQHPTRFIRGLWKKIKGRNKKAMGLGALWVASCGAPPLRGCSFVVNTVCNVTRPFCPVLFSTKIELKK
jgi:hypothetical protein